VFVDEVAKGLIYSEGNTWKKSRAIISNLFHFEMLRSREGIMYEMVERFTQGLHEKKEIDLFKLGCTIGGEIVVESLFGKDFNKVRFGKNTPL
jgi:cytochrome P450